MIVVAIVLTLSAASAHAFDVGCTFGAQCIVTQGTKIPTKRVIEMTDRCDEFIKDDVGRRFLKMSLKEINDISKGNIMHPLVEAQYAWSVLYDSPLKFERKGNMEDTNYFEVKRACEQLTKDFNNEAKWTK